LKKMADVLTASRFILACIIAFIAWTRPPDAALGTVVLLILLAWTTDVLDGPLARRAAEPQRSWLGAHDLEVDLSVTLAMVISLALWGGAHTALLVGIVLAGALGWAALRSVAPVNLGMGLIDGLFILMAWRMDPTLGWMMIAWIGAAAVLDRARARVQVTGFLRNCQDALSGRTSQAPPRQEG
jgi:phosphatidylglycerophosphate synthase